MDKFQQIIANLGAVSYLGILGATFVANLFPGIPEEVFLIALGYMIGKGVFVFWLCLVIVLGALFVTDNILYFAARKGNKAVRAAGNFLLAGTLEQRLPFIEKHIGHIVFFSRFIFQARFLGPFLAGTIHYPYKKFVVREILALATYVPLTFLIGMYFQDRIEMIISGVGIIGNIILLVFVLLAVIFIVNLVKKHLLSDMSVNQGIEKAKGFFGFTKIKE